MQHQAIFLDRDGTLVHPRHYPSRPEELILYDGIGPGLRRLQAAGFKLIIITNQSGLARALFTVEDLDRMHVYLSDCLAELDVRVDGVYYCPHHPEGVVPELAVECGCRKPQPGMLVQAAQDLNVDLTRSWFVGDILDDVEAGHRAGCRTVLVDIGTEARPDRPLRTPTYVARDTEHALDIIAAAEYLAPPPDLDYRPARWGSPAAVPTLALSGSPLPLPVPLQGGGEGAGVRVGASL